MWMSLWPLLLSYQKGPTWLLSWHKYEQLDTAFLYTGSLLDPFFILLVFYLYFTGLTPLPGSITQMKASTKMKAQIAQV